MRVFLTSLVAAVLVSISGVGAQNLTTLTIGVVPSDETTPVLYGMQSGMFRRAGLTIDLQKIPTGAVGMAALAGGSLALTSTNSLSMILSHLRGLPLVAVAPGGIYNSTTDFVAAVTKPANLLRSGKDLNNKVIGVGSIGDLNAIALLSWMDANGGDSKTVKQVEIPYSTIPAALEEDRIEASILLQPVLSQAVDTGRVRIFAKPYDAIGPRFLIVEWITSEAFSTANPDVVRRFARVMREAEIYCNAHHAETAPLLGAFAGVDPQQVLKGGRDTYAATILDPQLIQPVIDAAVKYGVVDRRFDASAMVSPAIRGLTP
jgi:NitT/TauT family transport system substrate-binding protein